MKKLSLNYASFLLILITNCTDFYAQKGIVVSGANVSTSSGSISSSIGQVDYQSSLLTTTMFLRECSNHTKSLKFYPQRKCYN
ncbi:MAG: hypothetical protein IPN87_00320 [Saprospiraceae bacterium]|nr:hypothetical protein [Candidatus Brachybacter algidus]